MAAETPTDGDYRTKASGNWNGTSTWQVRTAGNWSNTSLAPTSSSNIYIQNGHTLTINLSPADCNNVNLSSTGILAIGVNTLRVNGKLSSYYVTSADVTTGLDGTFYSGQVSYSSLTNTSITSTQYVGKLSIVGNTRILAQVGQFGGLTTGYDLNISLNSGQTVTAMANLTARAITINGGTLDMDTYSLFPNGGTANTGSLTIETGGTLSMVSGILSRTFLGNIPFATFTLNGSGVFKSGTVSTTLWPSGISTSFSQTSTVEYNTNGSQYILGASYGNLTLNSNTVATKITLASSTVTMKGMLSIQGMASFALGSSATIVYSSSGTLEFKGSVAQVTGTTAPMWPSVSGPKKVVVDNTLGVNLNASGGRTISGLLTLTAGTFTLTTNLTMLNTSIIRRNSNSSNFSVSPNFGIFSTDRINVTIAANMNSGKELIASPGKVGTLTTGAFTYTLKAGCQVDNLDLSSGGVLADGGFVLTVIYNINGTGTHTGSGKIMMTGSGFISGASLTNLEIASTENVSLNGDANIAGTLTLTTGTFSIADKTLTIQKSISGTTANLLAGTTSSLTVAGTASIIIPSTITALKNLTITNVSGVTLQNKISITNGTCNVTGLLILGNHNLTESGTSSLTGNGTLQFDGALGSQIRNYSVNTLQRDGTYFFNGTSQDVPAGTYGGIRITAAELH